MAGDPTLYFIKSVVNTSVATTRAGPVGFIEVSAELPDVEDGRMMLGLQPQGAIELQTSLEATLSDVRKMMAADIGQDNALAMMPPMPRVVSQLALGVATRGDGRRHLVLMATLEDGSEVSLVLERQLAQSLLDALPSQLVDLDAPLAGN